MSERVTRSTVADDGTVVLLAPIVGEARELLQPGDVVVAGRPVGVIETLGRRTTLLAPAGTTGRVVERCVPTRARTPVEYGAPLLRIDPRTGAAAQAVGADAAVAQASSLVFRAPMGGRFYARPAPTKPLIVEVGAILEAGHGICLLEVMKTFNRVSYGGEGLPARARVVRVVPHDGDDVARGAVLLELEAVD